MRPRRSAAALLLAASGSAVAAMGAWSGSGPLATGAGDRVIDALLFDPATGTLHAGNASGTVLSLSALHEAHLAALTLASGSVEPPFVGTTTSYSVTVPAALTTLALTPTAVDPAATITVDGLSVANGSAHAATLVPGANVISVEVTAQDGVTRQLYTVTVVRGGALSLTATPTSSRFGQPVVIVATIAGASAPTGTIAFDDGGTALAGCSAVAVQNAAASCGTSTLGVGSHTLGARYSGDGNNAALIAATVIVQVGAAPTVTPVAGVHGTVSPNAPQAVQYGERASFTVTPDPGYIARMGGECGGTLAGVVYVTDPVTTDCSVRADFLPPEPVPALLPLALGGLLFGVAAFGARGLRRITR